MINGSLIQEPLTMSVTLHSGSDKLAWLDRNRGF